MTIRKKWTHHNTLTILTALFVLFASGTMDAESTPLSVNDAIKMALAGDQRIASARWEALAARAKIEEANRRKLPAVTLSAGYTRLSDLKSEISFGPFSIEMDSLDNVFSLSANMQYPIFAGFRIMESVHLAELQSQGKEISSEMMKRSIVFETERAYWEAVRATHNASLLRENLELMKRSLEQTKQQLAHGTAMNADLLAAETRCEQAEMDVRNGATVEHRAYLSLASVIDSGDGSDTNELTKEPQSMFTLVTSPEAEPADEVAPLFSGTLDEAALIRSALGRRPETRNAELSMRVAETSKKIAAAPLYPSLNLTGNYTYADPNSRVVFQTDPDKFTGTWSLGLSLSYDLGSVPANLSEMEAQADGVQKSSADHIRQNEVVILDVRNCALAFLQTRDDIESLKSMLAQTTENERVMNERIKEGTANAVDLLGAQTARLRSEFAIINKQIDLKIATADLSRAAALKDIE